jgi:hypothetical protein
LALQGRHGFASSLAFEVGIGLSRLLASVARGLPFGIA